jgi:hypothetical protein
MFVRELTDWNTTAPDLERCFVHTGYASQEFSGLPGRGFFREVRDGLDWAPNLRQRV